jgi:hypothetical protein
MSNKTVSCRISAKIFSLLAFLWVFIADAKPQINSTNKQIKTQIIKDTVTFPLYNGKYYNCDTTDEQILFPEAQGCA